MTATTVALEHVCPLGGVGASGLKIGFVNSQAKAAQNDTWVVSEAKQVIWACPTVDATGATGTYTLATNVITLTSATTGAHSGIVLYI